MSELRIYDGKRALSERNAPHIFTFAVWMAACLKAHRGGRTSDHIRECYDLISEVIGKRLLTADPLPPDYDWRPSAAIDTVEAMLECEP